MAEGNIICTNSQNGPVIGPWGTSERCERLTRCLLFNPHAERPTLYEIRIQHHHSGRILRALFYEERANDQSFCLTQDDTLTLIRRFIEAIQAQLEIGANRVGPGWEARWIRNASERGFRLADLKGTTVEAMNICQWGLIPTFKNFLRIASYQIFNHMPITTHLISTSRSFSTH